MQWRRYCVIVVVRIKGASWSARVAGLDWGRSVRWRCGLRGSVVIDKSFVIMVLACAAAPLLGAGIYLMMSLF